MIDEKYNAQVIEEQIQATWQQKKAFHVSENVNKEKFYCLAMFPYPSGQLHVGHVRNYTISDVIARYQWLLNKNVLQVIGWDAFGLPAENAAIAHGVAPANWTYKNIDTMRCQLKRLGFAYDWHREISSCDWHYYRWEQWLFIKMYEKGLVYRKNAVVNWDPVDHTVLANEQVINGRGWRSGAIIERREIAQWFVKITAYAKELLEGLDTLDWPQSIKTMQRHWIGRSEGVEIIFTIASQEALSVFTTRPETLMAATYIAIAPKHPLANIAAKNNPKLQAFIEKYQHLKVAEADIATLEKEGVATGFSAIHPITKKPIPIWVANYVLLDYGCGAVMAVPGHDQRDFEFAKRYQLPIKKVIEHKEQPSPSEKSGILINSHPFDGLDLINARHIITDHLITKQLGKKALHYRLRDWGVSRQRYWGTPIPMVHCKDCGILPVAPQDLPVRLPEDVKLTTPHSPLKNIKSFYETSCPKCHQLAYRDTDTFDTFVESSWYFNRFACSNQQKAMLDDRVKYWLPVDQYVGGIEHAIMHLLYARFIHKVLRDFGFVNCGEPFKKLLAQGMVLKKGMKMSKSKNNTVSPQKLIEMYGADTLRFFIIFAAPPSHTLEWSDNDIEGANRFLKRLWTFAYQNKQAIREECLAQKNGSSFPINWHKVLPAQRQAYHDINNIIKQATQDIKRLQLNTLASACMKLLNILQKTPTITHQSSERYEPSLTVHDYLIHQGFGALLALLYPISPHISEYLWCQLHYGQDSSNMRWPKLYNQAIKSQEIEWIIQIDGKLRAKIKTAADVEQKTLEQLAKNHDKIKKHLKNSEIKNVIIIANKIINIVTKGC